MITLAFLAVQMMYKGVMHLFWATLRIEQRRHRSCDEEKKNNKGWTIWSVRPRKSLGKYYKLGHIALTVLALVQVWECKVFCAVSAGIETELLILNCLATTCLDFPWWELYGDSALLFFQLGGPLSVLCTYVPYVKKGKTLQQRALSWCSTSLCWINTLGGVANH